MRSPSVILTIALAIGAASGGACGMTQATSGSPDCRVIGGEKLFADPNGATQLCAAIEAAVKARVPGANYRVDVRALPGFTLGATIRLGDGRTLPELRTSVMDGKINQEAIEAFARSLGEQVAAASGR